MAGNGRSLGPKGFLTEEEKQNMPKVTKELLLSILSYLKETERLIKIVYKLNLYSTLKITKDSTDPLNIKLEAEVSNLITDYSVKTAFVQPELALNSDEFLTELKEDPELKNETVARRGFVMSCSPVVRC